MTNLLGAVRVGKPFCDGALLGAGQAQFRDLLDAAAQRRLCGASVGAAAGAFDGPGIGSWDRGQSGGYAEASG